MPLACMFDLMETGIVSYLQGTCFWFILAEYKEWNCQSIGKVLIWGFGLLTVNKGAERDIW